MTFDDKDWLNGLFRGPCSLLAVLDYLSVASVAGRAFSNAKGGSIRLSDIATKKGELSLAGQGCFINTGFTGIFFSVFT